jgi:hypothetical protein
MLLFGFAEDSATCESRGGDSERLPSEYRNVKSDCATKPPIIQVWSRQKLSRLRCHCRRGMTIAALDPAKEAEQAIEDRQWMRRAAGNPQIDGN